MPGTYSGRQVGTYRSPVRRPRTAGFKAHNSTTNSPRRFTLQGAMADDIGNTHNGFAALNNGSRPGSSTTKHDTTAQLLVSQAVLQPTDEDHLADATAWVDNWPDAVGHTNLLSALSTAHQYETADSWYLFSDGLPDDGAGCLLWVQQQQTQGKSVPPIHCVGE